MDIFSYLLGKKSGGGASGHNATIDVTQKYKNTGIQSLLTSIDYIDTSKMTSGYNLFSDCMGLKEIPSIDTSNMTTMYQAFNQCQSITKLPHMNTSKVTNMMQMCYKCVSLVDVPYLDTSSVTGSYLNNAFFQCNSLSDESINNILKMCIDAKKFTDTKKLTTLGFSSSMCKASRIRALSNYQAFIDAGWTIGYS